MSQPPPRSQRSANEADAPWDAYLDALEARHLADLTFQEVARALRALSSCYVERRTKLAYGAALDGAGKRAAFALFYAPLHALVTTEIVRALGAVPRARSTIVDLGCGTGTAGAAWARAAPVPPAIVGIDRHPWSIREAEWSWRTLGLRGHAVQGDATRVRWPRGRLAVIAAFTVNEMAAPSRDAMRERLLEAAKDGHAVLVIEPIAGAAAPWWRDWTSAFGAVGCRADAWRFSARLPEIVAKLDRAAGLDHRELTGRTIYCAARDQGALSE